MVCLEQGSIRRLGNVVMTLRAQASLASYEVTKANRNRTTVLLPDDFQSATADPARCGTVVSTSHLSHSESIRDCDFMRNGRKSLPPVGEP